MKWDLFLVFPNLSVPASTPFAAPRACLCSGDDPRVDQLADSAANATGRTLLAACSTSNGQVFTPACLLLDSRAPRKHRDADAIRAFRNICAVCTTTRGTAATITGSQLLITWSDFFRFSYFVAGKDGWVQTLDGPLRGTSDELPSIQSADHIGLPSSWHCDVDLPLLKRLVACWERYVSDRTDPHLRRLFRALEVAFHAGAFPGDGLTSLSDIGTRVGLWVSALEVLFHPGTTNVNKEVVMRQLAKAPLSRPASSPRYTVRYGNSTWKAPIAAAIYDDLYAARNAFMHGNPVGPNNLRFRGSPHRLRLISLAPVLFNVALLSYLDPLEPGGPQVSESSTSTALDYAKLRLERQSGAATIENALNAARYQLDRFGRTKVPESQMRVL